MGATRNDCIGSLLALLLAAGCAADASDALGSAEEASATEAVASERDRAGEVLLEARVAAGETDATRPLVLVAGLMQDANTVAPLAAALRDKGHDVTVWIPPNMGLDDINGYAAQLGKTVDEVIGKRGASQVDLIGHSEGGLTARLYVKQAGESARVHTLISLGSPQQGTEGGLLSGILRAIGCESWAPACPQMVAGSSFLAELNGGDPTPGDVRYVTVGSRNDGVVQPVARAGIPGAENVIMQDVCKSRAVGHFGLLTDAWVHQVVLSVLADGPPEGDCRARPIGGGL